MDSRVQQFDAATLGLQHLTRKLLKRISCLLALALLAGDGDPQLAGTSDRDQLLVFDGLRQTRIIQNVFDQLIHSSSYQGFKTHMAYIMYV